MKMNEFKYKFQQTTTIKLEACMHNYINFIGGQGEIFLEKIEIF